MDERERRVVENEARFLLVNERSTPSWAPTSRAWRRGRGRHRPLRVRVRRVQGGDHRPALGLRMDAGMPARFVIATGNELPEFERVVRDGDGYRVVEKLGDAQQAAAASDPRRHQGSRVDVPGVLAGHGTRHRPAITRGARHRRGARAGPHRLCEFVDVERRRQGPEEVTTTSTRCPCRPRARALSRITPIVDSSRAATASDRR